MPTNLGVPNALPVSIGTHQYQIAMDRMRRRTLPALRPQVDQALQPGEQTLNAEGSWIRSQTDWSHGDRQEVFDDGNATPRRYAHGSNVRVDRRGRIELTPELQTLSTTRGGIHPATSGRQVTLASYYAYWIDWSNRDIYHANLGSGPYAAVTPTLNVTGTFTSVASEGATVWAADGTSQLYRTTTGNVGGTIATWGAAVSAAITGLGFANGRLLGFATSGILYEITSTPALTTIFAHPGGTNWVWYGAVSAPNAIYLWGALSSLTSTLYLIDDLLSGATLAAPRVAATFPNGEIILKVGAVGGVLIILTSVGLRVGFINADGSVATGPALQVHALGPIPEKDQRSQMRDFAFADESVFVFYDRGVNAIARVDLSEFASEAAPAIYAREIATGLSPSQWRVEIDPNVNIWLFSSNAEQRLSGMSVRGSDYSGVARPKATTGFFYSGWITYGISETKQLVSVQLQHDSIPTGASIQVHYVGPTGGSETSLGTTSAGTTSTTLAVDTSVITPAREFQLKFTFTRGTTTSATPTLRSWSCRAIPIPARQEEVLLPILLFREVETHNGVKIAQNPYDEYVYLKSLVDARTPVTLVEGGVSSTVIVDAITFPPSERDERRTMWGPRDEATFWEGICEVRCVTVA